MADVLNTQFKNLQMQLTDETGKQVGVNFKTDDTAVSMSDGTLLKDWCNSTNSSIAATRAHLWKHAKVKHLTADEINTLLTNMTYDETTGKLVCTKYDGTTDTLNTALNKIAVNFTMEVGDPDNEDEAGKVFLVLTLEDDSTMKVDVTSLVDIYQGSKGEMVIVSVDDEKRVSATLCDGSIPIEKLTAELQQKINDVYRLPAATDDALGGFRTGKNIVLDEDGRASAEVVFLGEAPVSLHMTVVENMALANLSVLIKNINGLSLEDGTTGVEVAVRAESALPDTTVYSDQLVTSVYIRELVDNNSVTSYHKITGTVVPAITNTTYTESGAEVITYGSVLNSFEKDDTVAIEDSDEFKLTAGKVYEVYASVSIFVSTDNTDLSKFHKLVVTSQHKYLNYMPTSTP